MTGVSPSDLRDKVVDVRMDDGAYRLVTETISFEIFADDQGAEARRQLNALRRTSLDLRLCLNDDTREELNAFPDLNREYDEKMGIERKISWISDDGRDFVESTERPLDHAPEGVFSKHRREVKQRPQYWEAVHVYETPAHTNLSDREIAATRAVSKQSMTYIGPCNGSEWNLSPEWKALLAEKKAR